MRYSKWIGISGVVLLYIAAFQPWVWIASKNITVTGMHAVGTNFGRPALLNLITGAVAMVLFYVPTITAKRTNLFFCAFNIAWSLRNFIIISTCRGGDCPEKRFGLYLLLAASLIMIIAALFPDVVLKENAEPLPDNRIGG